MEETLGTVPIATMFVNAKDFRTKNDEKKVVEFIETINGME